jgi:ATP-dependent DNA helicase DinG
MAAAVARAFDRGGVLLAEAGTGTGKTLAYLAPAILSRQRVLVSTGTKNLQEQIFFKDIPALAAALGIPFTATYMKGRANYLCLHRLDRVAEGTGSAPPDVFLPLIQEWAARTETGDRAELDDLPENLPFWNEVSATADTCLGTECPRYDACFVTRMRQAAASADLVIVNHHLLCADAAVRQSAYGEVIPSCSCAVLDEAHQLEDVATQYFGLSLSSHRLEQLARDLDRFAAAEDSSGSSGRGDIASWAERLRTDGRAFFGQLASTVRPATHSASEQRLRVTGTLLQSAADAAVLLNGALDLIERGLLSPQSPSLPGVDSGAADAEALAGRAREIRDQLRFLLRADDPDYVYFIESRGRHVVLRASPIDVSTIVRDLCSTGSGRPC